MLIDFCCMHSECTSLSNISKESLAKELSSKNIKTALIFYEYPLYKPKKVIEKINDVTFINGITYDSKEGLTRLFIPDGYYRPFSNSGMSNNNLNKLVKTLGGTIGVVGEPILKGLKYDYAELIDSEIDNFLKGKHKLNYYKASRGLGKGDLGTCTQIESEKIKELFSLGGVR